MDWLASFVPKDLLVILTPVISFLVIFSLGMVIRKILFIRLVQIIKNTQTKIDDVIVSVIKGPSIIWCLMFAIYFSLEISNIPNDMVRIAGKILLVLGIISVTLVLASISSKLVKIYSGRLDTALPVTSLTQNIARIIVFCIGIMIILNSLGISVAPILATLGVGGLAVALALQDTLSNLFAGFHIIVARQIRIGDYIKLDSGEEGYVADITWRTTKIRVLPNNIVLVPNEKLSKTILTNYYFPDKELAVLVNMGVHYDSDLKKVEKAACEVGKEVMRQVSGGVPSFDPFIRYHTFGDFSINFTVILRAKEFVDQYLIKHEFVKRMHERCNKEGIIIPYPIRAINFEQEKKK